MGRNMRCSTSNDFDTQSLSSTAPLLPEDDRSSTYGSIRAGPPEYHFYKGNGLTSKARISCNDGREFCLDADIHQSKDSIIVLYAGKNAKGSRLGSVVFPTTHNTFDMYPLANNDGSNHSTPMVQARARVGHPHPSAYNIKLPETATSQAREVSWTITSRPDSKITRYQLCDDWNRLIATWSLVSDQKYQAVMRWHVEPPSGLEETVVLLSFIGGLSRLKLKGKADVKEMRSTMTRYNGFWFMAILGTAAVA